MTHFTVLVAARSRAQLDELMAPYDENITAAPRRDYEEGAPEDFWAVEGLRKDGKLGDYATLTWEHVANAYNCQYSDEFHDDDNERLRLDEAGRAYTITTYNPLSKWDYYRIGGRWGGAFPIAEGAETSAYIEVIMPQQGWDSPELIPADHCDGGLKRALDLERMRREAEEAARRDHREYMAVVKGSPEALPWRVFAENISEAAGYDRERAALEYNSQPRVQRLKGSKFADPFGWDPVETFSVSEDEYAASRRAAAVPGYALLTAEGEWMQPGEMGWFAMSSDTAESRAEYHRKANAYIDALPDDTWLIMCDCHI